MQYVTSLDIALIRKGDKFETRTYYKPIPTGLYMNWYSFSPRRYKINLIKTLLSRAWSICSSYTLFDKDNQIKEYLVKNQYPSKLVDATIKNFVNKKVINQNITVSPSVDKKELLMVLPYHGKLSENLRVQLVRLFNKSYS